MHLLDRADHTGPQPLDRQERPRQGGFTTARKSEGGRVADDLLEVELRIRARDHQLDGKKLRERLSNAKPLNLELRSVCDDEL